MVVISIIYPCNFGCPNCPYTDGNSDLRKFYHAHDGDLLPQALWNKMADECGPYQAWMRCTGGGEPMLHPRMVEMIEYAKGKGARVWLNTNGSMFGPLPKQRRETYAKVRPPHGGPPRNPAEWWKGQVANVQATLELRKELRGTTRVVVSIIQQEAVAATLQAAVDFWLKTVGVDEVITRKFLSWDDNTVIPLGRSLDPHLYRDLPSERKEPCVWPFERLNVDTLGRVALCGQDISFRTAKLFPNINDVSIKDVWHGETFSQYRRLHLAGRGAEAWPCRGCSAWLAGIRDWEHGWLKVLKTSGRHLRDVMRKDLGVEVQIYEPPT